MNIGIVGLPNVGKSTLFKAITKKEVDISNYPFCTIDPNVGIATVPDKRLEKITEIVKPEKVVPAVVEFVDIAGLVKGAHKGEGLGNQFLSHIYAVDAILLVLRCFEDKKITHVEEEINPKRDLEIVTKELELKDELLIKKPLIKACNIKTDGKNQKLDNCDLEIDFKIELEASELDEKEMEELEIKSKLPELIKLSYKTLDLITFYTIKGGKELRASSLKRGLTAPEAGGRIHTDFEEKFIRAEVINYDEFITSGGWSKAREKGLLKTEGKDYVVKDGDIIEFKI
jgi:small GTP-binding protein